MIREGTPLDPEAERFFFEVETAELLGQIRRAAGVRGVSAPSARAPARARGEISRAARALARSLYWYRRAAALGASTPAAPWPARELKRLLGARIREASLRWAAPSGTPGPQKLSPPADALVEGVLGAAVTLGSASGSPPGLAFEAKEGLLFVKLTAKAAVGAIDPVRLLRFFHWPGAPLASGHDAGLPFLAALIRPEGGELELIWRRGRWTLEATIPTVP